MPQDRSAPLDGVVVLDLGQIYNGPYATFLMAMAGAMVIKIEPPGGESLRAKSDVRGLGLPFAMLNSNKRSVVLDLKSEAGRGALLKAVSHADILLENFAPGTMDRLGLGWETLQAHNGRLIYASGSGFGSTGPSRHYPAMDITVQAMAGLMSVTGFPDGPPTRCGPAICDFSGGIHLYAATITALYEREKTGRGRRVEVSMQDAVFTTLTSNLASWQRTGETLRSGNRHGAGATVPYNVYRSSDGHLAITCVNDRHWQSLARVIGRPELAGDPRFADLPARAARIQEVDEIVEGWTSSLTKQAAFEILMKAKIPAAPVRTVGEVANDEDMHQRGMLNWFDHSELGRVPMPGSPLRFEGTAPATIRGEPALDEFHDVFLRAFVEPGEANRD